MIAKRILQKVPSGTTRKLTYVFDGHTWNYRVQHAHTFMCMADTAFGKQMPFVFLREVSDAFFRDFPQLKSLSSSSLSQTPSSAALAAFSPELCAKLELFNEQDSAARDFAGGSDAFGGASNAGAGNSNNNNNDGAGAAATSKAKVASIRAGLGAVSDVMRSNIERVIDRGENIDSLVDKTDTLHSSAASFRSSSTALRKQLWWSNVKAKLFACALVTLAVYAIAASYCGVWLKNC
jgi:hypothetical protein